MSSALPKSIITEFHFTADSMTFAFWKDKITLQAVVAP